MDSAHLSGRSDVQLIWHSFRSIYLMIPAFLNLILQRQQSRRTRVWRPEEVSEMVKTKQPETMQCW